MTKQAAPGFGEMQIISGSSSEAQLLIDLLEDAGIDLENSCASTGTCGKCRVQILNGKSLPAGPEEMALLSLGDLEKGIRLACYCLVQGEVLLRAEQPAQDIRVLESGLQSSFELEPAIRKEHLSLVQDNEGSSLLDQILSQLGVSVDLKSSLNILRLLGENARTKILTAVVRDNALIGLELNDTTPHYYGLAVDIGTTTVVAALLDLSSGAELAVASALNPQTHYGLDVLSRIQFAGQNPASLNKLNDLIIECLNKLIDELCEQSGVNPQYVYEIAAAANTVMLHLLLKVSPASMGRAPYNPVFRQGQMVGANMLGITVSPFAQVYCLPLVSGFIGADIIAGIMATELDRINGTVLFLDLGTNGEIVLNKDNQLIACSTAAGPALEGMNIACGMRAANGAVEEVWLQNNLMRWRTIGDAPPQGLCGSGLLDVVAAMLDIGMLNTAGRIMDKNRFLETYPQNPLVQQIDEVAGKRRFWLIPSSDNNPNGVFISQADIRQVQLAKSAIVTGIKTLLAQASINEIEVNKVYVAGAFGAYLSPECLIRLGFFPDAWRDRIFFVGNTSKAGAKMALLSSSARIRMGDIAKEVDYIELESCPNFEKLFVQHMSFPGEGSHK